jgi:LAO/AO transport system kinase
VSLQEAVPERFDGQHGLGEEDRALVEGVLARQLRPLAKAITLIESSRPDHQRRAEEVLQALLPHTGGALRLGISGVPGVGKSTFIEALGLYLIERGYRVAVLAVDPSSSVSGGSILGGVAEKTRETMLVCEAAGFDVVIVETVGVGQSETAVANMTDMFVLLQLPNAGDDLQGIKKGIMELADLIVINKADADSAAAMRAKAQLETALHMLRPTHPDWRAPVLLVSALKREGLDRFWETVLAFRDTMQKNGALAEKRRHQALAWMWERIDAELKRRFRQHPAVRTMLPAIERDVESGRLAPVVAARRLLDASQTISQ